MPSQQISEDVAGMKQLLKAAISKSYGSVNAEAHIFLDGFEANENDYILPTTKSSMEIRQRTEVLMKGFDKKLKKQYTRKWADEAKKKCRSYGSVKLV